MSAYYSLPYVSNSELGSLQDLLYDRSKPDNIQGIYDFGNLVDAMLTEKDKFDNETGILTDQGRELTFTDEQLESARLMQIAGEHDSFLAAISKLSNFQHIILRERFLFEQDGWKVYMKTKCKYDLLVKKMKIGGDIKTTGCTTLEQFIASIFHFNYDRQGAFYMDMGELDKFVYIGISKKKNKKGKHEVFKFVIQRGDETYLSGKAKYNYLGFKYFYLVYNLKLEPLKIHI